MTEAWLRGPIEGVDPLLLPAAHALVQARDDLTAAAIDLPAPLLWTTPGGAASVGFHLRHVAGSIDRLLTYAAGRQLSDSQGAALSAEGVAAPGTTAAELVAAAQAAIDRAVAVLRATDPAMLHDARVVGRVRLPSTVFGLLFHIAEHTQRHTGQIVTTAKIVRGPAGGA